MITKHSVHQVEFSPLYLKEFAYKIFAKICNLCKTPKFCLDHEKHLFILKSHCPILSHKAQHLPLPCHKDIGQTTTYKKKG